MNYFEIVIKMGNDAMQTREDIANALEDVIRLLKSTESEGNSIHDANGNRVGQWQYLANERPQRK